jgi:serine/threonine-protein kinase
MVMGTIAYLSPQRLAGAPACVADDLYAVGVVGYEALAGHRPFPHDNMIALARAILQDRPPPLARLRPDVDADLITVIERAMAPDVRQRFGGAEEMRSALHGRPIASAAGMGVAAPQRPGTRVLDMPLPPPVTNTFVSALLPRTPRRKKQVLAALALLAVLMVIPLALALDASSSNAPSEPVTTSTPSPVPVSNPAPPAPLPTEQPPAPPPHGPGKGHGGKGHGGDGGD